MIEPAAPDRQGRARHVGDQQQGDAIAAAVLPAALALDGIVGEFGQEGALAELDVDVLVEHLRADVFFAHGRLGLASARAGECGDEREPAEPFDHSDSRKPSSSSRSSAVRAA